MPRTLSPLFIREKNQLASTHVLTRAFEITIPNAPSIYRLVNYDQDVLFHGLSFLRMPMRLEDLEDANSMTLPRWRITIENVSQTMHSLIENYWTPDAVWTVVAWEIDTAQADETPLSAGDTFTIMQITTDLKDALVDMQAEGFTLGGTMPKRRFTELSGFPGIPRRF
jgi:hypothetical protein